MRVNLEQEERIALVRGLFGRVVPHYDLLNHVFSLGRDLFWRRAAAKRARVFSTGRILDVASGTGDLSLALAEAHPGARVVGADFTLPMLVRALEKYRRRNPPHPAVVCGDALRLPFPDAGFDSAAMAFGIRNIPDRFGALKEILRVLAPGGRCLVLELTFPRWPLIRKFYHSYLNRLIPKLGGLISGHELAYQYLADSIMDFPQPPEFMDMMNQAGYVRVGYRGFTFGICALYWGEKP
jgi:demethylmenaquinone methyltransferase/2-methoxy-6-polyprenyl-1,4-benzoquinol methylase